MRLNDLNGQLGEVSLSMYQSFRLLITSMSQLACELRRPEVPRVHADCLRQVITVVRCIIAPDALDFAPPTAPTSKTWWHP